MLKVNELTDEPKQKHTLVLPDGSKITMVIEYKPLQIGWFLTSLAYAEFEINNMRVVSSPNMLHQFKNQLPFGIAVFVDGDQEPTLIQDFLSGRAQFFILTAAEVQEYEDFLSGQTTA